MRRSFCIFTKTSTPSEKNRTEFAREAFGQLLINEVAHLTQQTDEKIASLGNEFVIHLNTLSNSKSFLFSSCRKLPHRKSSNCDSCFCERLASEASGICKRSFSHFRRGNLPETFSGRARSWTRDPVARTGMRMFLLMRCA